MQLLQDNELGAPFSHILDVLCQLEQVLFGIGGIGLLYESYFYDLHVCLSMVIQY